MSETSVRCCAKQLTTLGEYQLVPGSHPFAEHILTLVWPWPRPDTKARTPNLIAHVGWNYPRLKYNGINMSGEKCVTGSIERPNRWRRLPLPALR